MNKEPWSGFQPIAHTYIKQHTDYEGNVMFSVPAAISEGAAEKINFALSAAKPYEFYTFDADGDYTVHIVGGCHDAPGNYGFTLTVGDTPEPTADAIIIDGTIVTREDVRRLQLELDALAAQVEASQELLRCWQTWLGASREQCDESGQKLWDKIEKICTPPQQHLRDVRAEAGRIGFIAGYNSFALYDRPHAAIEKANKYASGVKDGVE